MPAAVDVASVAVVAVLVSLVVFVAVALVVFAAVTGDCAGWTASVGSDYVPAFVCVGALALGDLDDLAADYVVDVVESGAGAAAEEPVLLPLSSPLSALVQILAVGAM